MVERWVNDDGVRGAIAEFKKGDYKVVITTGQPLGRGYYLSRYKNLAYLTVAIFIALGFDKNKLIPVPTPRAKLNRTAASAVALREWLDNNERGIKTINLYSYDAHTRRSWLLFKRVLGPEVEVGSIAHSTLSYNPKRWFTSSEGVRSFCPPILP